MRWLASIIDLMDMNLSKLWEIVKDREVRHATVHGITRSGTRLSNRATTTNTESPEMNTEVLQVCWGVKEEILSKRDISIVIDFLWLP